MLYLKDLLQKYKFKYIFLESFLISTIIFLLMSSNLVTLLKDSIVKSPSLKDFKFYNVVSNIDEVLFICALVLLILYAITKGIMNKIWRDMLSDKICYLDKIIFTIFSIELLFFIFLLKLTIDDTIVKHLVLIFIMITILLFECRIFLYNGQFLTYRRDQDINNLENYIKTECNVIKNKTSKLITLKDLLDDRLSPNEVVLIEERAIECEDEDLFKNENKQFIVGLEKILLECSPRNSYVFALLGKWGSGKTSIINLLKEKMNDSEDTKIQTFSPWKYDDKNSLFAGFYYFIARNIGISSKRRKTKILYRKYLKIIFGIVEKKYAIPINEIFSKTNKDILEEMREDINNYISSSNKKMIVVIDDIDRLNKEQILLVFNIINNVFNFNNLVYILCFDEERIVKMFHHELSIDPSYVDKIIQHKITMPKIDSSLIKGIGINSMKNIIKKYDLAVHEKSRLDETLTAIFNNFHNLREIIRFLNSMSSSLQCFKDIDINISDLITLEYIKHTDIALYYELANNADFLVCEDQEFLRNYTNEYDKYNFYNHYMNRDNIINKSELSDEAKDKFDKLFNNKLNTVALLAKIFPPLQTYYEICKYGHTIFSYQEDRTNSILRARCFNGKFFNVYFNNTSNDYTKLNKRIEDFIKDINDSQMYDIAFTDLINPKDNDENTIQLLMELISMRVSDIKHLDTFIDYVLSTYMIFEGEFNNISTGIFQNNIYIIFRSCLKNLTNKKSDMQDLVNKIFDKDVRILYRTINLSSTYKYEEFYIYSQDKIINYLNKIIETKYDLFDKKNYKRGYVNLIYYYNCKGNDAERIGIVKNYMNSLINKDTVFRFIGETLTEHLIQDNKSTFECASEDIMKNLADTSVIDNAIEKLDYNLNKDQEKVKQLYEGKYLEHDNIDFSNL